MHSWNKLTSSLRWSIKIAVLLLVLGYACTHPYTQGEQLYLTYCANCHMEDGSGLGFLIPPLAGADYLDIRRDEVPCIIRYGAAGGLTVNGYTYNEPMPGFSNLNEIELSNLINYMNTSWGNNLPETSPDEVKEILGRCPENN